MEIEVDLDFNLRWPRRGWIVALALVLVVVLLWLLGRGHTPVVNGRPAVLTPQRKAVLDYLSGANGWTNEVASCNVVLEGLMPVTRTARVEVELSATPTPTATAEAPVLTSTVGITVPLLPTATPIPMASPMLPGDLLSRVEQIGHTRALLQRLADLLAVRKPPPGMEGVHGLIGEAVAASQAWCDALLDYYSDPAPEKVAVILEARAGATAALDDARRALDERRAVIMGGGNW